ncbi:MAG: V-type ATP synthase subunit D [Candidatus Omnitrophica bacterium]|nr:V-type ATP synthase subunit D [Candidatus Omnitrophota bacterium]MBU4303776.1 V-type ATP synthase subunit D [Candidatus Omnitrophota bacterium]MBU4419038.1 V-type ATP synthase subunit D [Candidatus Omnitrophota bacterium]MBU4468584.1 V-type ATP synthase subunit D [Candidatus Omnitrophota bacterium]MCG2708655.1 V-type ATP synthase subunit D [Candidatus Omnitrophota bacterium]
MAKIKLTKGELKRQRDCLKQFKRYLPTLQLKKQQLQLEILQQNLIFQEKKEALAKKRQVIVSWTGLLTEPLVNIKPFLNPEKIITHTKNIAGVDIPVLDKLEFGLCDYDLFVMPLWLDLAIQALREVMGLDKEILILQEGVAILRQELRITTQRVNLFEKVKIPLAEENIRLIKIYIGDQMANAVGRCKIAKRKIEALILEEASV